MVVISFRHYVQGKGRKAMYVGLAGVKGFLGSLDGLFGSGT